MVPASGGMKSAMLVTENKIGHEMKKRGQGKNEYTLSVKQLPRTLKRSRRLK